MDAETLLRAGQPQEALAVLRDAVRKDPSSPKLRKFLCQLQIVNGEWERALNQLQVIAGMEPENGAAMAQVVGSLIRCEGLRAEVFAGKKTPLLFGEPEPWMGWLLEANRLLALGQTPAALELQAKAFDAAPASAGMLDGQPFEWIADADPRLGPMLEVHLEGRYYWIAFKHIQAIELTPPTELRDLVWAAAKFTWTNGGEAVGFLPARYPGSESDPDGAVRLGRKTEWRETAPGVSTGVGQRVLATDQAETPLLEIKSLTFAADAATVTVAQT